jgi:CRISPR-associated protein Csm3
MKYQLIKKIIIKGEIIAKSGIMVGGSTSAFQIGGTDKQVIRNPINQMPYIPGSSLKGKMRSLLELNKGTINSSRGNFGPTHNPEHLAAQLFGHIKNRDQNNNKSQQASRIIVRDAELTNADEFDNTELLYTEVKAENSIDRITSAANPRFFERVPKGAKFGLEIIINIFSSSDEREKRSDNEEAFIDGAFTALKLVQDDYLGGGGSRGNGQIQLNITNMEQRTASYYTNSQTEEEKKASDMSSEIPEELKAKKDVEAV